MRAAILAVGSELLGTTRLDTNSLRLTKVLWRFGVHVGFKAVVGDNLDLLAEEIRRLSGRFDLLILTGGLGPTEDDLTREGVAKALGRRLERRPEIEAELERKFARFGLEMPEVNRKQADVIAGAQVIDNQRGTAPGLVIEEESTTLFLFPGVPTELEGMLDTALLPWLGDHRGEERTESVTLKLACLPESTVEERLAPFYENYGREGFSVLASVGEVTLQLTGTGTIASREEWLLARRTCLEEIFGEAIFASHAEATLEGVVGDLLRQTGATVATAESCTGGLIAERLTRLAGSSAFFRGGAVTYTNELKNALLGVSRDRLDRHGAVSSEVVCDMARGARTRLGSDFSLAVSGIAGPGGGSEEKPVGTVHVALAGPDKNGLLHRRLLLPGDRTRVRWLSSQWALELLRRRLLQEPEAV
jgi:nicotinamide-nucleotide amidase